MTYYLRFQIFALIVVSMSVLIVIEMERKPRDKTEGHIDCTKIPTRKEMTKYKNLLKDSRLFSSANSSSTLFTKNVWMRDNLGGQSK